MLNPEDDIDQLKSKEALMQLPEKLKAQTIPAPGRGCPRQPPVFSLPTPTPIIHVHHFQDSNYIFMTACKGPI
jgi:hypothetical protein